MIRFAVPAAVFGWLLAVAPSIAAESIALDPFEMAQLRSSLSGDPDVVERAVLRPSRHAVRPDKPRHSARRAPGARLLAKVDLSDQRMNVYVDGELRHTWKVSTAGKGYVTPTGTWTPYRMHTMWHSRKYDNAPMPHSIFYSGGYAIHATPHVKRLGRPASHGCVRLHPANAKELFALAKRYGPSNMRVTVQH